MSVKFPLSSRYEFDCSFSEGSSQRACAASLQACWAQEMAPLLPFLILECLASPRWAVGTASLYSNAENSKLYRIWSNSRAARLVLTCNILLGVEQIIYRYNCICSALSHVAPSVLSFIYNLFLCCVLVLIFPDNRYV